MLWIPDHQPATALHLLLLLVSSPMIAGCCQLAAPPRSVPGLFPQQLPCSDPSPPPKIGPASILLRVIPLAARRILSQKTNKAIAGHLWAGDPSEILIGMLSHRWSRWWTAARRRIIYENHDVPG
ncbi:hypothetical protein ASPVEDRAFT_818031 [Aspergillus versicolor CBS 583.65]|uniref:Secreted protein n=1 Tax=Aspergillus versicolor CBS 583.65 TaxID=1036611 RepID=A0A1L9PTK2_ASPVE|nr:uncharacterized protein ASPVEDRAFT_818031 [Aspergillus versicolor CBS 583.65]OJJ04833.1 hypothetical protein ASPVEDRAFT_818031 [Aspergillus versicolor CBS 583.65]